MGMMLSPAAHPAGHDDALAGVHPVLHRDLLDRLDHLLAGKREHRRGGLVGRELEGHRHLLDRLRCRRHVEAHAPAEEIVRVDVAEHDGGVRDGGLLAALAVAGGAGARARALRADAEQAAGVDPGDGTAAGADAPDIHRGEAEVVADPLAEKPRVARVLDLAAADQAHVEGGAAGIDDDHVVALVLGAGVGDARERPHRGPRLHRVDRLRHHVVHVHHAARRRADQHLALAAGGRAGRSRRRRDGFASRA